MEVLERCESPLRIDKKVRIMMSSVEESLWQWEKVP